MAEQKDKIIGGFKVLQEIQVGAGSQGTVYKAECVEDKYGLVPVGTLVALKVMAVQDEGGAQWRKLQKRTAELNRLNHPNVVKYHGCFSEQGLFNDVHVVVQEFLQGETLKERLAKQKTGLDVDEGLRIVDAALAGLEYTAGCGLVHRDVKPGNIFLCDDGGVKLIDFEIAKQEGGTATASVGNIRGSFDYMAPDFTDPEFHGDVQSDVFSMGVVLHEVLCGNTPYERLDGDDKQANFAFLSRWSQTLSDGHSPIHVSSRIKRLLSHADEVIVHALAPKRDERYRDFAEFRKALKGIRFRSLKNGGTAYQLLQFIGKGGFGEVFKARNRQTGQLVAVKHLMKAAYAERFHREAKIMRKLVSPCFVQLVDFFVLEAGGGQEAFLVMAFLDGMPGSSLRDAIKRRAEMPMEWRDVFVAFARYARGLLAMHKQGIFHRDIKPSNLYYPPGRPGASAIMDLGIARDVNGTATTGQVPGTLDYMPPEVVISDSRGDGGMDIYALGLCLYEALTGKMAFPRLPSGSTAYATFFERAKAHRTPTFDAPEVTGDPEVLALLKEMTDPDATKRMRNAGVLLMRLEALIKARFGDVSADAADYGPATVAPTTAIPDGDAGTIATSTMLGPEAAALESERRRVAGIGKAWRLKALALAVLLVALAASAVYRFREPIFGRSAPEALPTSVEEAQDLPSTTAEDPAARAKREKEEADARRIAAEAKQLEEKKRQFEEEQKKAEAERKAVEARLEADRKQLEADRKADAERKTREEADRKEREEKARKAREEADRKEKERIAADKTKSEAQKAAEVKRIEDDRKKREAEQAKRDAEEKARREKEEAARIAAQKEQQRKLEEQQAAIKKQQEEMEQQRKAMEAQQAALKKQQDEMEERRKVEEAERKRREEAAAQSAAADKDKLAAAQEAAIAKAVEEAKKKAEAEVMKQLEAQKAELERQLKEAQERAAKEKAEREAAAKKLEDERKAIEEARKKSEAERAEREAEAKKLKEEADRLAKEKAAAEKARLVSTDKVKELVSTAGMFYENEEYYDAVKNYRDAVKNGYTLKDREMREFEDAFARADENLRRQKDIYDEQSRQGRNFTRDIRELEDKSKNLKVWRFDVLGR